jgi:hypothetical protein
MKWIGVIGPRNRNSDDDFYKLERAFFEIYEYGDRIVSGGCPEGGDRFAERIYKKHQIPILILPAEWDKRGKAAGFIRNSDIAAECNILLALEPHPNTGGTWDTVGKARGLGKDVILVP